jgi:hypothetical protein
MNRAAALEALVSLSEPISHAVSRLASFPWDSESDAFALTPQHLVHALSQFKAGVFSAADIERWANALECREDLGFSTALVREVLHELANPLLTEPLTTARAEYWLPRLSNGR